MHRWRERSRKIDLMKCAGMYHPDEGEILSTDCGTVNESERSIDHDCHDSSGTAICQTRSAMVRLIDGSLYRKVLYSLLMIKIVSGYQSLIDDLGINVDPHAKAGDLSASQCQMLEIARAVSYNARIIIMDEPTSSLTEAETNLLFHIIRKLTAKGVAIIYISHKIDEILEIAQNVTIMRDGKIVGTWPAADLNTDLIVKRMVGREMSNRFPRKASTGRRGMFGNLPFYKCRFTRFPRY